MDRFSKTCLILIVLLLAAIATHPLIAPQPARGATPHTYQALLVQLGDDAPVQKVLDEHAAKGWDLIAATPVTAANWGGTTAGFHGGGTTGVILIFQR